MFVCHVSSSGVPRLPSIRWRFYVFVQRKCYFLFYSPVPNYRMIGGNDWVKKLLKTHSCIWYLLVTQALGRQHLQGVLQVTILKILNIPPLPKKSKESCDKRKKEGKTKRVEDMKGRLRARNEDTRLKHSF